MQKPTKPEFWIAAATLVTALLGVVTGYFALEEQNRKLDAIHAPKPLEGIWNYRVDYQVYHGEDYTKDPAKKKRMEGTAAFVWSTAGKSSGYDVLISAKVYLVTDTRKNPVVVASSINRLITPESGGPAGGLTMTGSYFARLTTTPTYDQVGDADYAYDNLKPQLSVDGTHIDRITFDFTSPKDSASPSSKGIVAFSR